MELNSQPNVNTPFVLAFAVLGLVLAVLITANVVSAAVIASYRRIGVLKSIGFTPAQITAAYLAASLNASIHKINHSAADGRGQVEVAYRGGNLYTLTPSQNARILAAVHARPGTLRYTAEADPRTTPHIPNAPRLGSTVSVGVAGRPGLPVEVHAYQGDSSWLGWNLIAGRWYDGPHEVDATQRFLAATGRAAGDSVTLTVNGKPVTARIAGEVFIPGGGAGLYTSWQALGSPAGLAPSHYDIALKPGTSTGSYTDALNRALGPGYVAYTPQGPSIAGQIDTSFFHLLALLVAALAGLGVLNSVLMATRERVHDIGVFKAVGMTPWQTLAMVICGIVAPTIVAAAIATPAGLITQDLLVRQLAAAVDMVLPASFVHVLGATDLLLLALAGLGIAAVGALGPAIWAATAKTTTALRAE